jgi:hypothetical protein
MSRFSTCLRLDVEMMREIDLLTAENQPMRELRVVNLGMVTLVP